MISIERVVINRCDSCGTNVDVKVILADYDNPPVGIHLCSDCREVLKNILIGDEDGLWD